MRLSPLRSALAAATVTLLVAAPAATAADRFATPTAADLSGACTQGAPCRLDHAINDAAAGDDVTLVPGTYTVATLLSVPAGVTIHGRYGRARAHLVGATSLGRGTLVSTAGGTVRHLTVDASAPSAPALELTGGTGEDLLLSSAHGAAAQLGPALGTTLLRDAVAWSAGVADEGVDVADGAGYVDLVNVTARGTDSGDSKGVSSRNALGQVRLTNVIARGETADLGVKASVGAQPMRVDHSAFRPAMSAGAYVDAGGNVAAAPLFAADPTDLHPLAGSPTVDAGVGGGSVSAQDPDGTPRTVPDIGAYELAIAAGSDGTGAAPTPDPAEAPDPDGGASPPPPVAGRRVTVTPRAGRVLVRRPGARRFTPLGRTASVPVGSELDTRAGTVRLASAVDARGTAQAGTFWGGRFQVRQRTGARPVTELRLTGGDFSSCPRARASSRPGVLAAAAGRRPVRRLWGADHHGRFRTRGRSAHGTVRGTRWLTTDTCAGTRVTVKAGAVSVKPLRGGRSRLVRAGHSLLVRAR